MKQLIAVLLGLVLIIFYTELKERILNKKAKKEFDRLVALAEGKNKGGINEKP